MKKTPLKHPGPLIKMVKNPIQAILALLAVVGFFLILGVLLFREVPAGTKDLLLILLGCLTGIVIQVYQFYFGSSKGSQEKTEQMAKPVVPTEPEKS